MTKNVQVTPSSAGVSMSFAGGEGGGGPNGIQVNPVGQVEELRNGKAVELKNDSLDSYQGAFTSRNVVKNEVVDVSGTSSIKPTTINGIYHPQPSSSPPPGPLSTLFVARIQADASATYPTGTYQSKQEPIEELIHTAVTMMDSTHYVGCIITLGPYYRLTLIHSIFSHILQLSLVKKTERSAKSWIHLCVVIAAIVITSGPSCYESISIGGNYNT